MAKCTIDGSTWNRIVGPLFSDGVNAPRISIRGTPLPPARVVSRTMHPDEGYHEHAATIMIIAFGQFMDHDFTLMGTPLGKLITCMKQTLSF